MRKRMYLLLILYLLGMGTTYAQWTKKDSLRLDRILSGKEEFHVNKEALKDLDLTTPLGEPDFTKAKPMMSLESPSLKIINTLPKVSRSKNFAYPQMSFGRDSTQVVCRIIRPYNISTKYNDDPIPIVKTSIMSRAKPYNRNAQNPNMSLGVSFSMEDLLESVFWKSARAKKHNAKNANAWKTY